MEDDSVLQLNILSTIVKINLELSSNGGSGNSQYSNLLQKVLELATKECENADVRIKLIYIGDYYHLLQVKINRKRFC